MQQILIEIIAEKIKNAFYWFKNSAYGFAKILNFLLPFVMYFLGSKELKLSWFLLIPIFIDFIILILTIIADRFGKGKEIPKPTKRFTQIDSDGEVSIEQARVSELLLYMADLEDWLQKHHYV